MIFWQRYVNSAWLGDWKLLRINTETLYHNEVMGDESGPLAQNRWAWSAQGTSDGGFCCRGQGDPPFIVNVQKDSD